MNRAAPISVSLAFGPHSCATTVNATVGGWPSGSTVCLTRIVFAEKMNAKQGNSMYHFSSLLYDSTGYWTPTYCMQKRAFYHWATAAVVRACEFHVWGNSWKCWRTLCNFLPINEWATLISRKTRLYVSAAIKLRRILDFERSRDQRQGSECFLEKWPWWRGLPLPFLLMLLLLWHEQDSNSQPLCFESARLTNTPRQHFCDNKSWPSQFFHSL